MKRKMTRNLWASRISSAALLAFTLLGALSFAAKPAVARTPAGPESKIGTYYYLVFSNPVAGREDEYNSWYDHQHALDVVAVPGMKTAQRFVLSDPQLRDSKPPAKYLVIYTIVTDDLPAVQAEVSRRLKTGMTVISPSFDLTSSIGVIYKTIAPPVEHQSTTDAPSKPGSQKYYQLVFSDPVAGKEDEYNKWYSEQHVPDIVAVPGFVSGQRLSFAAGGVHQGTKQYQYLVMFKIVTDDLPATFAEFHKRAPQMVMSPAFGESAGYTYKAIGPLIDGDKVRADRAHTKGQ